MAVATAMAIGALGAAAGGSILGGIADQQAANAQASISDHNSAVALQSAQAVRRKSMLDQMQNAKVGRAKIGAMRASYGASGVLLDEGAPADVIAKQEMQLALQNALIGEAGEAQAAQYESQAWSYSMQAGIQRAQGRASALGGYLSGGTTLLSGVGAMAQHGLLNLG